MRILNIGSLNVDYVYRVDAFIAPGETKAALSREVHSGGKGLNQSIALAKAGARTWHAGKIGSGGEFLAKVLADAGVDTSLLRESSLPAGHAVIQVDASGQNCILLFGGSNRDIEGADIATFLEPFGEGDLVLFQNEVNRVAEAMRAAKKRGIKIAFNPSPMDEAIKSFPLELVDFFILNEVEAEALTGVADGAKDPEAAIGALLKRSPEAAVVLTLGSRGSIYARGGERIRQPAYRVEAVDTTAAGDTFTGYFLAATAEGAAPRAALDLAAKAAAICVTRRGAAPSIPARAEVEAAALRSATGE
jgi:ribokinase